MCEPLKIGDSVKVCGEFFGGLTGVVKRVSRLPQGIWLVTVTLADGREVTRCLEHVKPV